MSPMEPSIRCAETNACAGAAWKGHYVAGMDSSRVRDNPEKNRFEMDIGDALAIAAYRAGPNVFTIYHTEVPRVLEGQGYGSALVRGALDIIRARGLKLAPRCPFVSAFIARHPEYQDLVS
ncbi:MAG TPA: GNAT family N-acetyltransferase [Xanthobacteraceae bacterium]|nr:GNAT family N-acetyltransferase [Xanthobacteraceae bacterium]